MIAVGSQPSSPLPRIRIGEQSLHKNGLLFVNTMFGRPIVSSADLPGDGPGLRLLVFGGRGEWRPSDPLTFLVGVPNGSPRPRHMAAIDWTRLTQLRMILSVNATHSQLAAGERR